jgi:ankyrin repeat protein
VDKTLAIIEAVKTGDKARVEELLHAEPALANARAASGESALLLSVYAGKKEITDLLLARGAEAGLFEAAAAGLAGRVRDWLTAHPQQIGSYSPDGFTPLHLAVFFGHRALVHDLLDWGADVNAPAVNRTFARGVTPLHSALARGYADIAETLLARGADVHARDGDDGTPLLSAAFTGNTDMVRRLLAAGAEVNSRHKSGLTPLGVALKNQHMATAEVLREAGGVE